MRQHESSVYSIRSICMIFMNVRTTHLPADVSIYVLYCFVFVVFRFWFLICAPHFLVFLLWNKNNKNNWEKIEYNASYSFGVFICRCHICLQLAFFDFCSIVVFDWDMYLLCTLFFCFFSLARFVSFLYHARNNADDDDAVLWRCCWTLPLPLPFGPISISNFNHLFLALKFISYFYAIFLDGSLLALHSSKKFSTRF